MHRLLSLIILLCAFAAAVNAADTVAADLDRDGTVDYVAITCKKIVGGHPLGGDIVVSHKTPRGQEAVWRQPGLNPWKVALADVDGDGRKEVIAGVWKKSRYDPVFARRVFVYSWNGKRLLPKWLGSRLNRRFTDFVLCPLDNDGKTELVALEEAPRGGKYVTAYRWESFGFGWVGRSGPVAGVRSIAVKNGRALLETERGSFAFRLVRGRASLARHNAEEAKR